MAIGSRNDTVDKFKAWCAALPKAVLGPAKAGLQEAANDIADEMRARVRRRSGNTAKSIRVEPGEHELSVVIRAGGPLTTEVVGHGSIVGRFARGVKAGAQGKASSYDHALAEEFGTQHMLARPFFWSGYNAAKKRAKAKVRKRIKDALIAASKGAGVEAK